MSEFEEYAVVSVGEEVPDFTLETYEASSGKFGSVSLASLKAKGKKKGKWTILVFYPADFTFVCPTELADLADQQKALEKLGAKVISVSTDTKFSHLAWHREERLLEGVKYTMAADPTGEVSNLFGVYDENTGLALRGTFIISPDGKLVSSQINFYNLGRNMDELVRIMEANAHCEKRPNDACPAKWSKGDKALTPNEKMVGNVYEAING